MDLSSLEQALLQNPPGNTPGATTAEEIHLRTSAGYIQWRSGSFGKWASVISIKDLTGDKGDKGKTGDRGPAGPKGDKGDTGPQGKIGATGPKGAKGDRGANGIEGERGPKGEQGVAGTNGKDGIDGKPVELNKSDTHIQWRYAGESAWQNLVKLSGLVGPKGDTGADGEQGERGPQGYPGPAGPAGENGSGGSGSVSLKYNQPVIQSPNGVRTTFTIAQNYVPGSLWVTLNGLIEQFVNELTPNTFSFDTAPLGSDIVLVNYVVL